MAIEVIVTRDSSFCPGVDRAFRITEKILFGEKGRTFSIGPLIHNPEVVRRLGMLGLEMLDPDAPRLPNLEGVNVVVRSHGIDVATEERLRELGARIADATCPTVKRAQEAARELAAGGCDILLLGSAEHPEVRSIVGRVEAPVTVLDGIDEAASWVREHAGSALKPGIVCQTTISRGTLEDVLRVLTPAFPQIVVKDTICESVARRQEQASEIARGADLMIVVGGRESSNTGKLAARCAEQGVATHLIESPSEIRPEWLEGVKTLGVTGGASTPDWLIQETVERIEELELLVGP